jgi:oligopeptide transport system substrate-binding protein
MFKELASNPRRFECVRIFSATQLSFYFILAFSLFLTSCTQLRKPTTEPYFAQTPPPRGQEFRWSNGRLPKSLDPATASAPPETDVVRAIYEGLTELDPKTLQEMPAVAENWTASDDLKTWTFNLRKDAKWTNGSVVTAQDFVFAWRRLASMGDKAAHAGLLQNIVGYSSEKRGGKTGDKEAEDFLLESLDREIATPTETNQNVGLPSPEPTATPEGDQPVDTGSDETVEVPAPSAFGVTAVAAHTLKVSLKYPDKDFPKLVANPIFRPVYDDGRARKGDLDQSIITNGAFKIAAIGANEIKLVKSQNYWDKQNVHLETLRFLRFETSEKALDAYRAGEVDAVSNADFSPAALKLLEPYEDFRRATHSALNLYQINYKKAPFDDRRVREALATAIERERVTEGQLEGSTQPALRFLPFIGDSDGLISQDADHARKLLEDAGFPSGRGFPVIKLLVNRNDAQQRIARSVARMWKQNLNLDTEIVVKQPSEIDDARRSGQYDVIRRGVVLPTSDEMANFVAIFGLPNVQPQEKPDETVAESKPNATRESVEKKEERIEKVEEKEKAVEMLTSEESALFEFWAIPLYFPTSYSLVKPYVVGFDVNSLDAPLMRSVSIDVGWQPGKALSGS